MSLLLEKVSYLQGLAEGMELDDSTKEGKILTHIIDLLGDFAQAYDEIDVDLEYLEDYVESVDGDLADIENYLEELDETLFDEYDDWDDMYDYESTLICNACDRTYNIDEAIFDEEGIKCPVCNGTLESIFEFGEFDDEDAE